MTDEDAALQAIATLDPLSEQQEEAKAEINLILSSEDPFIDIHELFQLYNVLYFRSLLLPRVEVSWSARLTLCAGICELVRDPGNGNKYTRIRLKLSEPLLKFRPRSDVINTLLHEAIHSYFFITTSWRHSRGEDGTGHGAGFLLLADGINNHGGYEVTVYHTFHDEVDSYRTHVWQCDGVCRLQAPFFGLVKRSMNRAPGKGDQWWARHQVECGGTFTKTAEPELTKEQAERLSGLKRAGRQRNKIDTWVGSEKQRSDRPSGPTKEGLRHDEPTRKRKASTDASGLTEKHAKVMISCPICEEYLVEDAINEHLDKMHLS
ncbi:hypothetical protein B0A50_00609 [Salinomyces thailandicus]|uniref:Protein with SprT-like domain at the N terminus n=1 Tax=Salinomyces thailandicus TaxID=706561 RepID=A0A4U0UE41_9PEZI|nr:hypothetical protein B0A50_00609 [Salinomyces thailandica]